MRISTANVFDASVDNLVRRQHELGDAQQQLTSGKRVNRASDDPAAAARAERALAAQARSVASQRAVDASLSVMTQSDAALGAASDLLQAAREALVATGNPSYGDAERRSLAEQIRSIRAQLLVVANRSDGADGYLFGGQGSAQPPFVDAPGGVQFVGTPGRIDAASSEALALSSDGAAAWLSAPTGNGVFETRVLASSGAWIDAGRVTQPANLTGATYTLNFNVSAGVTTYSVLKNGAPTSLANVNYVSGQAIQIDGMAFTVSGQPASGDQFEVIPSTPGLSVFDALDRAANELASTNRSGAQVAQTTAEGLRNVDSVMSRLLAARSEAGATLNRIDNVTQRLQALELQAQTERSDAEDLDMVKAISAFQNKQTGYDAALKSYSMVQRMSLFQYLNL
jgi:flagellar hook-associated protein 3 FlgL